MTADLLNEAPTTTPSDADDTPDDLFHIAATETDDWRAEHGLSWRTLCGQRRRPARERKDFFDESADDCVVCVEIEWAEVYA